MGEERFKCPLCSHNERGIISRKDGTPVRRCGQCGLVFLGTSPSREELRDIYSENLFASDGLDKYYICDNETTRANSAEHVGLIQNHISGGRLLDVGCGFGYFLNALGPRWQATGIEISAYAAERARSRFGLSIVNADFLDASVETGSFDTVTMWDYIEHAIEPMYNIQKAHAVLKPGGILFISTPDIGSAVARLMGRFWYHFDPLQHLCYFNRRTLTRALAGAGFSVVSFGHHGRYFDIDYLLYRFKYSYPGFWGDALYASSSLARRLICPNKPHIRLNPGDVMTVCAAKEME